MKSRKLLTGLAIAFAMSATIIACDKDDDPPALRSKEYTLVPVGASGVGGKITILENADKTLALTVAMDNSVKDTIHVSHIHSGSISQSRCSCNSFIVDYRYRCSCISYNGYQQHHV